MQPRITRKVEAVIFLSICFFLLPLSVPAAQQDWSREELKSFMKQLADYVVAHHLRNDNSPMRGMVYEFYDPITKQQAHGGGWDTMHDGAWFANACMLAYRATGDASYVRALRDSIMPFYVKMLNHSDTLFPERENAFSDGQMLPPERSAACKGFVPYFWDDGHGFNFDARAGKMTIDALLGKWGITNTLPDRKDTSGKISGYSHGTSNHMALDLSPMLGNWWLLTRDTEVAEAIKNLHEQRIYQMKMDLPFLAVPDSFSHGDTNKAWRAAGGFDMAPWPPETPLYKAMVEKKKISLPPFLDDSEMRYFGAVAGNRVGPGAAKRLSQFTYDCIVIADMWYGSKKRPRGLAIAADNPKPPVIDQGKLSSMAGDVPSICVGSRIGPQTLWACAQSLQLLRAFPDAWAGYYKGKYTAPIEGWSEPPVVDVKARLHEELVEGLKFWREQFKTIGYIRPDWPIGNEKPNKRYWRDQTSETGGYAHLIAACASYIMLLDGKNDWELAHTVKIQ